MGGFYSHNEVWIFLDRGGAKLRIHLVQALLKSTAHAIRHDVQKSQHSHFGTVNDFFFFLEESLRTRGACIHDGGHS